MKTVLRRWILAALVVLGLVPLSALGQETASGMTARQILDRADDLYRGKSAVGRMTMTVNTKHWNRSLVIDMWTEGKDDSLMRIVSPKKEKGTATLRVDKDIWNYLPKVNRVIKLPSSMMGGSWMGSHFTNNDLVKESRMTDDYDFEISFQGLRDGADIIEIRCVPKPDAAVVWGQIMVVVDAETLLPVEQLYYDEDINLARTMTLLKPKQFSDRVLPSEVRIVPEDKPTEFTLVIYNEIEFDVTQPAGTFSLRRLQDR